MSAPDPYRTFLEAKIITPPSAGLMCDPEEVNPILKPHQRACVVWAVRGGRRGLFQSFGLGKTIQQLEIARLITCKTGELGLIVAPLGVRREFMRDAEMLGIRLMFVRTTAEVDAYEHDLDPPLFLTNYESVREGKLDVSRFGCVSLDEASVLWKDAVHYCREAEAENAVPSLFDLLEKDAA